MKLEIDTREPKQLIDLIKTQLKEVSIKSLDIGDFIIKNDNDEIQVIFERKSFSDLISSIKDGRYNEQSFRLNESSLPNHNIYYILEGDINKFILKNNEISQKILFSAIFSLSYFKGFSIINSNNIIETSEFIIRFVQKLSSDKRLPFYNNLTENSSKNNESYSDVIKTSKKSNITTENIGEIMLSQIPGVSINTAQCIMKIYNNINNLINEIKNNNDCLNDIKMDCKNGKRNINKTAIKNIKEYLGIIDS